MPNLETQSTPDPLKKNVEQLRLETPEEEVTRLSSEENPEDVEKKSVPGKSTKETQKFLEEQEAAVLSDSQKAAEILEKIQALPPLEEPVVNIEKEVAPVVMREKVAKEPGKIQQLLRKLKFWEKDLSPEEKTVQTQEKLRDMLAKGRFDKVGDVASLDSLSKSLGITNSEEWNQVVAPLIHERVAEIIRQGDGKSLKKMLSSKMEFFGTDLLLATEGLSAEELRNPEVVAVINEHFSEWAQSFSGQNTNFIDAYTSKRDSLVRSGFSTAEELNRLPGVQKKMKAEIMKSAKAINARGSLVSNPPQAMQLLQQRVTQTGVFTETEIADLVGT